MFPDYAGTVLWLSYPVAYADSGLDIDLIEQLRRWEESYYAGLDDDLAWRDPAERQAYEAEGRRLAHLIAGALGDEFMVRLDDEVIRSRHPARSPRAAAALGTLAAAESAEHDGLARLAAEHGPLEWRA